MDRLGSERRGTDIETQGCTRTQPQSDSVISTKHWEASRAANELTKTALCSEFRGGGTGSLMRAGVCGRNMCGLVLRTGIGVEHRLCVESPVLDHRQGLLLPGDRGDVARFILSDVPNLLPFTARTACRQRGLSQHVQCKQAKEGRCSRDRRRVGVDDTDWLDYRHANFCRHTARPVEMLWPRTRWTPPICLPSIWDRTAASPGRKKHISVNVEDRTSATTLAPLDAGLDVEERSTSLRAIHGVRFPGVLTEQRPKQAS